jgi:hypothetical protein
MKFLSILISRLAKEILSYRIALRDAAVDNARLFGYEGWRYVTHFMYSFFVITFLF